RERRQLAWGNNRALSFLRSRTRRAESIAMVASRRSWWQSRAIAIEHGFHSERIEDAAVQEVEQRHATTSLHDHAGGDLVRVAVLPVRSRLEIERLLRPAFQDFLRRSWFHHRRHNIILWPAILVTGSHREHLADRNFVRSCEVGQPACDG